MAAIENILSGQFGPVELRYRLFTSDVRGNERANIMHHVEGADVNLSNFRDHTWELNLDMVATNDMDPLRDYITVVADVRDPTAPRTYSSGYRIGVEAGWKRYSLGTYRLKVPSISHLEHSSRWSLMGESLESLVAYNGPANSYDIPANQGILAKVREILGNHGVPADRMAFPQADKALKNPLTIDLSNGGDGMRYLDIINRLLKNGGYYTLQTDRLGRFVVFEKRDDLTENAPNVHYTDQWGEGLDRMVVAEVSDEYDDERFANKVIVRGTNVNDSPPVVSVQYNENPNSPASIPSLGRTILKRIDKEALKDQATADQIAKQELQLASSWARKLTLNTLPDLRRGPRETYEVTLHARDGRTLVDGRWAVTGWTLPLTNPPSAMTHELSRVEKMR